MLPGQTPIELKGLLGERPQIHAELRGRLFPATELELLGPGVEALAAPPGALDERRDVAAAAAHDRLNERSGGIVAVDAHGAILHRMEEQLLTALDLGVVELRAPLERGMRLGDEHRHRDGDGDTAALLLGNDLARDLERMVGELGDSDDVLIGLPRQTHHEVQLDTAPTGLERGARGALEVLLGHVLVDDVAHALAAGLGRKGEAALLLPRHGGGHVHTKGVEALRRNGDGDAGVAQSLVEAIEHLSAFGVIGGGERVE